MATSECTRISKVLPENGDLFFPYVINCVVMSVLSLTAIVGNVLILVSICRAPQFVRKPSYFLLVNLAFADFCVGFLAEPTYLVYKISYLLNPFSVLSCYAGITFNFLSYFSTALSLWTAAAISLDRLLALHLHMKYYAIVTKNRVCILIIALLALSSVFASMFEWALDAQNTVFACANSLALLIALLSYVRIFQIVRYHQRQISIQLCEVSFAQGREDDSIDNSIHERQDGREPMRKVRSETVTTKSSDKQTEETEMKGNGRGLKKIVTANELRENTSEENRDNQGSLPVSDGLARQQHQLSCGHATVLTDNAAEQPIEVTHENSQFTISGVAGSMLPNNVNSKMLNRQIKKSSSSEVEQECKESRSAPPYDNFELTVTEIQLSKNMHDCETRTSVPEPREQMVKTQDKEVEAGSSQDTSCTCLEQFNRNLNPDYATAELAWPTAGPTAVVQKTLQEQRLSEDDDCLDRSNREPNLNCHVAEETITTVAPHETLQDEKSSQEQKCSERLDQNHYQNYGLVDESSSPGVRQETQLEEHNEAGSSGGNNCSKRLRQNYYLKYALADETTPVVMQNTYQEDQVEASLSKDSKCLKECRQSRFHYYASVDEITSLDERQEIHQEEDQKTEMREIGNNNCFKGLYHIQNSNQPSLTDETTSSVKPEKLQEVKEKTTEIEEDVVSHGRNTTSVRTNHNQARSSYGSNATINENQNINRSAKGFKMRHFKKSVFNMFVIWFLMLLCYLPLICTSILVMFLGRSYSMHLAFNFTTSVMFVNSSINPIVFCWRIREFRAAVRKTLSDVFGFWSNQNSRHDNFSITVNE